MSPGGPAAAAPYSQVSAPRGAQLLLLCTVPAPRPARTMRRPQPSPLFLASALVLHSALAQALAQGPPPIYALERYSTLLEQHRNGTLLEVAVPGGTPFRVIHLRGDTEARGYAYGYLMADRIVSFIADLDDFCEFCSRKASALAVLLFTSVHSGNAAAQPSHQHRLTYARPCRP